MVRILSPYASAGRQCSRSGCSQVATATLTYQYQRSQVWLDGLIEQRDPHSYDLCARHADTLRAPQGWWVDDRRPGRRQDEASLIA